MVVTINQYNSLVRQKCTNPRAIFNPLRMEMQRLKRPVKNRPYMSIKRRGEVLIDVPLITHAQVLIKNNQLPRSPPSTSDAGTQGFYMSKAVHSSVEEGRNTLASVEESVRRVKYTPGQVIGKAARRRLVEERICTEHSIRVRFLAFER